MTEVKLWMSDNDRQSFGLNTMAQIHNRYHKQLFDLTLSVYGKTYSLKVHVSWSVQEIFEYERGMVRMRMILTSFDLDEYD